MNIFVLTTITTMQTGMNNLAKTCCGIIPLLVISLAGLTSVQAAEISSIPRTADGNPNFELASEDGPLVDRFQRTYEVLQNNEVATSGAARGETLYFYKCWMCHQEVASQGDLSGLVGPPLHDLAERSVSEQAVAAKIRNGGSRMPAFRHTFSDADVADLVSYLLGPTCCYENQDPPANPHYRAETNPWPVSMAVKGGAVAPSA